MSALHYTLDARTATEHFPGIGRYVFHLARALDTLLDEGEQMAVLYAPATPSWRQALCPRPWRRATCVPVESSPFGVAQQWRLPRLLSTLGSHVYHSPYYLMPYFPGRPTVLTVYDLIPMRYPAAVSRKARLLFRFALDMALRVANVVICISEHTKHDLLHVFAHAASKAHTIPLAADHHFRPLLPEACRAAAERMGLPPRYLLYVGSNKPHKNLTRLVRAWALLSPKDVVLAIAGVWVPAHSAPRTLAAQLGLTEHHVRFVGPVPEALLPGLYGGALGFVFPSLYEGFGLPVLEAMACGTAVACSRIGSLQEVAGDAALYFNPLDADEMAAALEHLVTDDALRAALRARGLERAARFTWDHTARRTLAIYRELAAV
ncbi:MAG: glycosyltransferase family 1 protein [Ardenticatenia bacterium]|nr:glycosyltransferase family 1 protein [Ardenticatenia bacterium]